MPYVPPHLRGGSGAGGGAAAARPSSDAPPPGPGGRSGRYSDGPGGGGGRDYGGGGRGDYGGGGGGGRDYGSSFGSRSSARPGVGRDEGYGGKDDGRGVPVRRPLESRSAGPPEVVWHKWKPSDRVNRLQEHQIAEVRARLNVTVEATPGTGPPPPPIESFEDMNLHANIMADIVFHSYTSPTPIQAQAMPVALSGRDMLGCAQTGSGKTAAFSIPLVQHCLHQAPIRHGDGPLALVLAPTRELAQQIEKEVKAFSRSSPGFKTAIVVGGTHMSEQKSDLRHGVEVVVATPGRFIDHLQQGNTSLSRVSYLVLDEADRMLDMGFEQQMKEIMRGIPSQHQTLLFSATMPEEIEALAQEYLKKPVRVKVGRVSSPTANVSQLLEKVPEDQKLDRLLQILMGEAKSAEANKQPQPLTIIFVERKARCDEIADAINAEGLKAASLHGGRSQGEREGALRDFRAGTTNILVATDVASRGLDVSGVAHVINMDLPRALEDYVHRIGRTGRAGASGRATSFHTDRDAFIVTQIKKALAAAEAGDTAAFSAASGKAARQKEREQAAAFRSSMQSGGAGAADTAPATTAVHVVDSKYRHMVMAPAIGGAKKEEGLADDAWDD